jgi:hypothetical protein
MLVSLNKNKWLLEWMKDNWREEMLNIFTLVDSFSSRPNIAREFSNLLIKNGYKTKVTKNNDVIIAMTEEEFVFLKLKYC